MSWRHLSGCWPIGMPGLAVAAIVPVRGPLHPDHESPVSHGSVRKNAGRSSSFTMTGRRSSATRSFAAGSTVASFSRFAFDPVAGVAGAFWPDHAVVGTRTTASRSKKVRSWVGFMALYLSRSSA